ncbi:MAG TPA: YnfA family protein [Thermodesulfobacteriota bacterium]|nr:YnfA family protein [Thermodesulfobacteriota bacterium]
MISFIYFLLAAIFEIAGCYTLWMWLRLNRSAVWVLPGIISLILFAFMLTRVEAAFAGRAYAAYGGVYIVASLVWLNAVEQTRPQASDLLGALVCIIGAVVILLGPRLHGF